MILLMWQKSLWMLPLEESRISAAKFGLNGIIGDLKLLMLQDL